MCVLYMFRCLSPVCVRSCPGVLVQFQSAVFGIVLCLVGGKNRENQRVPFSGACVVWECVQKGCTSREASQKNLM
jgi:hypothetical protein